jgi:hypothetical protein
MVSNSSSSVPNPVSDWQFVETWIDPTSEVPYVLLLIAEETGEFKVYDPKENYAVIFSSDNYEDAKIFLMEDEYEQVKGRFQSM